MEKKEILIKDLINLNALARELNINKSALHYWNRKKLIEPVANFGSMFLFNRLDTIEKIKKLTNKL